MHILGKVLLGFVIVLGAVGVALTAKTIAVRNYWMEQVADLETANADNAKTIADLGAELDEVRRGLDRTLFNWDDYWTNVQAEPAGGNEELLIVGLGTRDGLVSGAAMKPPAENPALFAFRPTDEGDGYLWVGPFQAGQVRETDAGLDPVWRVRGNEMQLWEQPGEVWRFRKRIPTGAVARFNDLQRSLTEADEFIAAKDRYIQNQQKLGDDAKEQNRKRVEQLLGPPNPSDPPADPKRMEYTHGLVTALAAEEETRNEAQVAVDRLRREIKKSNRQIDDLMADNKNAVAELP